MKYIRGTFLLAGLLAFLAGCPQYALVSVSPETLDFGERETELSFAVESIGTTALRWTSRITRGGDWMSVAPESGEGSGVVMVRVDRSRLPEGDSTGAVSVQESTLGRAYSVVIKARRAKLPGPPSASFSFGPGKGVAPLTVSFTDTSAAADAPVTGWAWDFGDGGTSVEQNPGHTYQVAGKYTVSLTVTSAGGVSTATDTVEVSDPSDLPRAAFDATPLSGNAPLTVGFMDKSQQGASPIIAWSWNFGDGTIGTGSNPQHVYVLPGTYSVALVVTNRAGSDTETKPGLITVSGLPALRADFAATPVSGEAPLTVTFADASVPGVLPIVTWLWSFGDGATSTDRNPSHTYAVPGEYTVRLDITDGAGGIATARKENLVLVQGPEQGPRVAFSAMPLQGYAPLTVDFADESTPGDSPISGWTWDFGDGSTSAEPNPSHVYAERGTYTVTLRVFSATGLNTLVKKDYISVKGIIGAVESYWPFLPGTTWTFAMTTDTPVGSATGTQTMKVVSVQSMEGYDVVQLNMDLSVKLGLFTVYSLQETHYFIESDGILYRTRDAAALEELPVLSDRFKPFLPTELREGDLEDWPYPARVEAGEEGDFLPISGQYSETVLYTLDETVPPELYPDCAAWKSRDPDWGFSQMVFARNVGPVLLVRFGNHELLGEYEFPAPLTGVTND